MTSTTLEIIATVCLIMILLTFVTSLLVMLGGSNIFKKASRKPTTAYYPILNLFTLLEITDTSIFLGILFFIPVVNIIVFSIVFYRLGTMFNTSKLYKIGLVLFPVIFYPMLAFGKKQYKLNDEEYFKALDNARGESINLMTQEEIKAANNEVTASAPVVDSIFKSNIEMMQKVEPYKAAKVDILGLEKIKQNTPQEDMFKPIEEVTEPLPIIEDMQEEKKQSKFTTELDKEDEVEFIDL